MKYSILIINPPSPTYFIKYGLNLTLIATKIVSITKASIAKFKLVYHATTFDLAGPNRAEATRVAIFYKKINY